ncbi:ribosomal-processing cysteine protease Prp [Vaccinium witches'-broom phytoplasma]|uniref:ribosomal-processing cysteine protease Prp n=1 Tax=Vaccinium witches'-broom phytoplasma TaxID=85642 RepID=UPI000368D0AB|nr:ribosomal-processing cysteine protease Prp [Vaccinium witches'-broom phytoplasma]
MIEYFFKKENNIIQQIEITGHALYAVKNKDIVCASVSAAIILTMNAIELFGLQKKVTFQLKQGYFSLNLLETDEIVNNLLTNLEYSLKDLNKTYSKYLQEKII